MSDRAKHCRASCSVTSCPFAYTDESEMIQNYGCIPTPFEILAMRVTHGKTWACHSEPTKPCLGVLKELNSLGVLNKIIDTKLITELDSWHHFTSGTDEILEAWLKTSDNTVR